MVVLSKHEYNFIYRIISNGQNCDIIHNGGCLGYAFKSLPGIVASNSKYFIPMVILQLLVHINKINKQVFMDALKYYLGLVYSGTIVTFMLITSHCAFRNFFGSLKRSTFLILPSFCASFILLKFGSNRAVQLFISSTIQAFMETKLMHRENIFSRALFDSNILQTLCFMSCSALILHAKQNNLYKGFWFMQPTHKPKNSEEQNNCSHDSLGSCVKYLMKGLRVNIAVGLTLDLFRGIINKSSTHFDSFAAELLSKLKGTQFNMTPFLTSYVLIYRTANCYLLANINGSPEIKHLVAAFLGGISYVCCPNISMLVYAMVLSGKVIWSMFNSTEKTQFEFLKKLPIEWILFPTSLAYTLHTYVFRNEVSKFCEVMIGNVTNNLSQHVMFGVQDILKRQSATVPKLLV